MESLALVFIIIVAMLYIFRNKVSINDISNMIKKSIEGSNTNLRRTIVYLISVLTFVYFVI